MTTRESNGFIISDIFEAPVTFGEAEGTAILRIQHLVSDPSSVVHVVRFHNYLGGCGLNARIIKNHPLVLRPPRGVKFYAISETTFARREGNFYFDFDNQLDAVRFEQLWKVLSR